MEFDRAVLIGIENYTASPFGRLDGPGADVTHLEAHLRRINPAIEICRLLDRDGEEKPTLGSITDAISWLFDGDSSSRRTLFYYSGHGSNYPTVDADEHDRDLDQALELADGTKLFDNRLNDLLSDAAPEGCRVVAIIDCCHSGDSLDLKYKLIDGRCECIRPSEPTPNGRVTLLSAATFEQSSVDGQGGGAFTNRLLKIIEEEPEISAQQLFEKLADGLRWLKTYFGHHQDPQIFANFEFDPEAPIFKN